MNVAEHIKASNLCIGCGYCATLSGGVMEIDASGFLVPHDSGDPPDAREEDLVRASCPGINGDSVVTEDAPANGATVDHLWGQYFDLFTGHSTNEVIRHHGSSGGVITALCDFLIDSGRVDGVLITTYDPAYPIGTISTVTKDVGLIKEAGGSKYCPAAPLAALDAIRGREGHYAVVGRPCDIATLRRAINAGDEIGRNLKYLLSFFCAGTPSDEGNRALLSRLGVAGPSDIVALRHRGNGWPGDTVVDLPDGTVKSCTYNESWGGVLRRHTHSLCKICPDGIGEQADIVAADAWYGDQSGYPKFEEAAGRSLVLARTAIGQKLLSDAIADEVVEVSPLDIREIDKMQPGQLARRRQLSVRLAAYKMMGLRVPRYKNAALRQYARGVSVRNRILIFIATLRRLVLRKFSAKR